MPTIVWRQQSIRRLSMDASLSISRTNLTLKPSIHLFVSLSRFNHRLVRVKGVPRQYNKAGSANDVHTVQRLKRGMEGANYWIGGSCDKDCGEPSRFTASNSWTAGATLRVKVRRSYEVRCMWRLCPMNSANASSSFSDACDASRTCVTIISRSKCGLVRRPVCS